MSFLRKGQFAWMAYSRFGLSNALYRGTKISFVRHANEHHEVKHLLAGVRTLVEGVNAVLTDMPRLLICPHLQPLLIGLEGGREGHLLTTLSTKG